jgi:hypothetical protein
MRARSVIGATSGAGSRSSLLDVARERNVMRTIHGRYLLRAATPIVAAAALTLAGCTALSRNVLVKDTSGPARNVVSHCSGSEWMDNSMIAVVPVPIVAFASPTQEVNEITTDDVLRRCGPPAQLANRHVEVDRGWCVPLTLTRLITLGVWHWCPANVSYDADVTLPPEQARALIAPSPTAGVGRQPEDFDRPNDFNRPTPELLDRPTTGVR